MEGDVEWIKKIIQKHKYERSDIMADYMKRSGKWQARIRWTDKSGKKHSRSKSGFPTKLLAKQWVSDKESELFKGVKIDSNITFPQYFEDWLKKYKQPKISPASYERYSAVKKLVEASFSEEKLRDITRSEYQDFINQYGKNRALNSVRKVNNTIRQCVKSAILDDLIIKDFTQNISLVANKSKTRKVEYLNIKEIKMLLKEAKRPAKGRLYTSRYMIITAIYTGMRLGEIQALTWNDIDFLHQTITINKSWDHKNKCFKPTKNESSNRTIKINNNLVKVFGELKSKSRSNMVFMNEFNTIPTTSSVNTCLRKMLRRLNINKKNFHFHSLRHSQVALLLADGIDLYAISKRLGHSNITTTSEVYAYLIDEYKDRSDKLIIKALDQL